VSLIHCSISHQRSYPSEEPRLEDGVMLTMLMKITSKGSKVDLEGYWWRSLAHAPFSIDLDKEMKTWRERIPCFQSKGKIGEWCFEEIPWFSMERFLILRLKVGWDMIRSSLCIPILVLVLLVEGNEGMLKIWCLAKQVGVRCWTHLDKRARVWGTKDKCSIKRIRWVVSRVQHRPCWANWDRRSRLTRLAWLIIS
jgi:hypothetical protein